LSQIEQRLGSICLDLFARVVPVGGYGAITGKRPA